LLVADVDGATGTLELRRERGRWLADDLGEDLLRSLVVRAFANVDKDDPKFLSRPGMRKCIGKAFADLSNDELKRISYMLISEREGSQAEAAKVMVPCLTRPGSGRRRSVVREKFEQGIRRQARNDGLPARVVDCVVRRLRTLVTDRQLGKLIVRGQRESPAIARAAARAVVGCRSQTPPGSSS
jgi:hypothetical protein